jgi:RNA polymerase sigma-70 factor (ECF subfamily)
MEPFGTSDTGARQDDAASVWQLRENLMQEHLQRVFVLVYRIVGNVADAQDVTQEVFIKVLQREKQLRDASKLQYWLARIASNTAIDFLRRKGRARSANLEDIPELPATERAANPEDLLLREESHQLFRDGLTCLSERERTALVLRDVEGLPAEEVARALGCTKATVRSHISNARVKFRKFLSRQKAKRTGNDPEASEGREE